MELELRTLLPQIEDKGVFISTHYLLEMAKDLVKFGFHGLLFRFGSNQNDVDADGKVEITLIATQVKLTGSQRNGDVAVAENGSSFSSALPGAAQPDPYIVPPKKEG